MLDLAIISLYVFKSTVVKVVHLIQVIQHYHSGYVHAFLEGIQFEISIQKLHIYCALLC